MTNAFAERTPERPNDTDPPYSDPGINDGIIDPNGGGKVFDGERTQQRTDMDQVVIYVERTAEDLRNQKSESDQGQAVPRCPAGIQGGAASLFVKCPVQGR